MNLLKTIFLLFLAFNFSGLVFAADFSEEARQISKDIRSGNSNRADINTDKLINKYAKDYQQQIGRFLQECYLEAARSGNIGLMYNFIMRFELWHRAAALRYDEYKVLLANSRDDVREEVLSFAKKRNVKRLEDLIKHFPISKSSQPIDQEVESPIKSKTPIYINDIRERIKRGDDLEEIKADIRLFFKKDNNWSPAWIVVTFRKFYLDAAKYGHSIHLFYFLRQYEEFIGEKLNRVQMTALLRTAAMADSELIWGIDQLAKYRGINFTGDEIYQALIIALHYKKNNLAFFREKGVL